MPKVLIAVGHGERPDGSMDPGAAAGGKTEQSEGDPIARACADRLEAAGVDVIDESYSDDPNFPGTINEANRRAVDLVVSFHHDWSGAPKGAFGHWFPGSDNGERLADAVRDRLKRDLGYLIREDWHKARSDLSLLKRTKMPAVIWECDRIGEVTNHAEYGRVAADGVLDYLGISAPDDGGGATTEQEEEDIMAKIARVDLSGVNEDDRATYIEGDEVGRIQALCAAHGSPPLNSFDDVGVPDKVGGPATRKALGEIQKRYKTGKPSDPGTPDYVAGESTWSKLLGVT